MAGEIGIVAFEGELNAIVREVCCKIILSSLHFLNKLIVQKFIYFLQYLECGTYEKTLRSFDEECALRGRPLVKELPGENSTRKKNERIVEAQVMLLV